METSAVTGPLETAECYLSGYRPSNGRAMGAEMRVDLDKLEALERALAAALAKYDAGGAPMKPETHEYEGGVCARCGQAEAGTVILCGPGPLKFHAAVHRKGAREWDNVGDWCETIREAFTVLGETLEANRHKNWPEYNRGGIWAAEKGESYYDPHQVYEVTIR